MADGGVGLSLGYGAETLSDLGPALDRVSGLGLDAVELFLPSLGVIVGGRVEKRALTALRAACAGRPFGFTLHGPLSGDLGGAAQADVQRAVVSAGLEVAAAIGAPVWVQHSAVAKGTEPDALSRARDAEVEALARLAPEARDAGCVIAVETMYSRRNEMTATPHELAQSLAAVDHPFVRATVDFSHAALNCAARGVDLLPGLRALAPFAGHMHIHDSFGRPPEFIPWTKGDALAFGLGDLHLPPGLGDLPWDDFAALPWPGPMLGNLELEARWRDHWADAAAWTRAWTRAAFAVRGARAR
jgi:sugar phosphate isomerase/epimerase